MTTSLYKCETCGAYNTRHQAGRDNPKQCYYCHGFDLTPITFDEPDESERKNNELVKDAVRE